jgi:hypothetical protein
MPSLHALEVPGGDFDFFGQCFLCQPACSPELGDTTPDRLEQGLAGGGLHAPKLALGPIATTYLKVRVFVPFVVSQKPRSPR